MKATDIIRVIMEKKEVKPSMLADRLKIKNNTLSARMTQKNISVLKLSEMLRVMDYKILIVPRNVQIKDDWYELTVDDEPSKPNLDELFSDPEPAEKPKYALHRTGTPKIKLK